VYYGEDSALYSFIIRGSGICTPKRIRRKKILLMKECIRSMEISICIFPESGRVFGHSGRQGAPSLYKQGGMTRPFSPLETPSIAVSNNKEDIIPALQ
jgi:hypothetical protein